MTRATPKLRCLQPRAASRGSHADTASTAASSTGSGDVLEAADSAPSTPMAGSPVWSMRRHNHGPQISSNDGFQAPEPGTVFQNFSRFNRDREAWIALSDLVLWDLAQDRISGLSTAPDTSAQGTIRCWSCGCSSGEEAYYLRMVWQRRLAAIFPEVNLTVIGTDNCLEKIQAARHGVYPQHSVQDIPVEWQEEYFHVPEDGPISRGVGIRRQGIAKIENRRRAGSLYRQKSGSSSPASCRLKRCVAGDAESSLWQLTDSSILSNVEFIHQDVSEEMPAGSFDVIMTRYAVCLYLEAQQKVEALAAMVERLRPGGFLIIGRKDNLPAGFEKRHGLESVTYFTRDEFCPFGASHMLEGFFRKVAREDNSPKSTSPVCRQSGEIAVPDVNGSKAVSTNHEGHDHRKLAATLGEFLRHSGRAPDWEFDEQETWRDRKSVV